ncbi:hypothetical protein CP533_4107 [Ophiocordyceps camponoti-saundersi (nom. inval.)]|nr:hypothetical protein CP533_4107 [Ophiocordyceps camponoti-saundersi (nom. inval.)]
MTGDAPEPGPDTDGAKHPKGRRKRTAAKDKTILEEAYRKNHKPDKEARLVLVQQVSLNEKEVQIWFQNRRQNDRRKSRPLSTEEIAALQRNGLPPVSRSFTYASDELGATSNSVSLSPSHSPHCANAFGSWIARRQAARTPPPLHPLLSGSVGFIANRRNLGASQPSRDSPGLQVSSEHRPTPTRSQSQMRLALSLEGKAELVSNQASPPPDDPPIRSSALSEPPQARRVGLQRSRSALPGITLPSIRAMTGPLPPLARGRSRDVQAWESCADSEKRDQLATQAEHESNGSAIAAISLLRSSSAVLQASSANRNSCKRNGSMRNGSVAELPPTKKLRLNRIGSKAVFECGDDKVAMLLSPNDSDKENWSPVEEDQGSRPMHARRRPLPSDAPPKPQRNRRTGRVLEEQKRPGLLANRANTAPAGSTMTLTKTANKGSCDIYEDTTPEDEVQRFLSGDVSPSKKGDMDCVASLLSLSQGSWR